MGLENPVVIKYFIRSVLATGYETINFIRFLKGSRETYARISDIKSRKTEENLVFINSKIRRKEEIISFPKLKIERI